MIMCGKCQRLFKDSSNLQEIYLAKDAVFYWCNECITKHLNSSEVKI